MDEFIKCAAGLDREAYLQALELKRACEEHDGITLKLELDYKLNAREQTPEADGGEHNEFFSFADGRLIGYIGICGFGGPGAPPEVTGMVRPAYRRRGVFSALSALAHGELTRRSCKSALLLCDRRSAPGRAFLKKAGGAYKFCEAEMYLDQNTVIPAADEALGISLQKAVNADAAEIIRLDGVIWNKPGLFGEEAKRHLPEEEEKRGVTTFLAKRGGVSIGKINLQKSESGICGIYGFGVLPELRGRGYGRAILLTALHKLKEEGAKEIFLQVVPENERALNLYKSCGFRGTSVMDYYELLLNMGEKIDEV